MARHWKILIGLALGVIVGALVNALWTGETWAALGVRDAGAFMRFAPSEANEPTMAARAVRLAARVNQFVGDLFVRLLRFAAAPLVLFSLLVGVAGLGDPRRLGRIGGRTVGLFVLTGIVSAAVGLLIANAVGPGRFVAEEARASLVEARAAEVATRAQQAASQARGLGAVFERLLEVVPQNPFAALASADMLAVIFTAVALGIGLSLLPEQRSRPVVDACGALAEAVALVVRGAIWMAPAAVFCLVAPVVASLGVGVIKALGVYCLCVVGGLSVILFVLYLGLARVLGGVSPGVYLKGMAPALMVAFSSSSSNATLPVSLACVIERLGVPPKIANFVLALGTTVNMDGTALYQAMATVFIAQVFGIDLTLPQQMAVVLGATLAAVGAPGIPGGGIVMLIAVLTSVGVPAEGVALIMAVDRILDMSRTVVNVAGDGVAAVIVTRAEGEPLRPVERNGNQAAPA